MNFDKLYVWALGLVIAFAAVGQLDVLQSWVWRAQARILYESRTATWGSPRFFPIHISDFSRPLGQVHCRSSLGMPFRSSDQGTADLHQTCFRGGNSAR